jgi:hypothetical protein
MEPLETEIDERLADLLQDDQRMLFAIQKGVHKACRIHKALGVPMVVWENGQVKEIPPEQIPID